LVTHDLVAVGEVMLDVALPPLVPGRALHTPVRVRAGGTPVNAALEAAARGRRAAVVGRVGADAAAEAVRWALRAAGVEALLAVDERLPTGTFAEAGDAIVADRGANAALAPADLPEPLEAGAVLVSGYTLRNDDTRAAAEAAVRRARARYVATIAVECAGANVLFANAAEAAALTGLEPEPAAVELAQRYEIVCVTLGAEGALSAAEGRVERIPPLGPDVTGGGDAFAAAFLLARLAS
jgi:sugar/nucleoside kinase (ribokinase family)